MNCRPARFVQDGITELGNGVDRLIPCAIQYVPHAISPRPEPPDSFENLRLELRRGVLVVATLAQLRVEHYGYTLRKALADHGLDIDENTLYPLLRRLEAQGLLVSEWREENKRNKRFYRLSAEGDRTLRLLLEEWRGINDALDRIAPARAVAVRRS